MIELESLLLLNMRDCKLYLKVIQEVLQTHRYNMLGDGWTVDVIAHILSYADFTELTGVHTEAAI